jgi:[ribosomal protein S18]-alanine N-acetyltransferase
MNRTQLAENTMAMTLPRVSIAPLELRQIRPAAAHIMQTWRYHGIMARYNIAANEDTHQRLCQHDSGYWQVRDHQGTLYGFVIIGNHAQVAGGTYNNHAVDLQIGLRPDLVGQLRGNSLCHAAVTHALARYPDKTLRVSIPTQHKSALAVWQRAGFYPEYAFMSRDNVPFVVLTHYQ